jgi:hypothetical protein
LKSGTEAEAGRRYKPVGHADPRSWFLALNSVYGRDLRVPNGNYWPYDRSVHACAYIMHRSVYNHTTFIAD